VLKGTVEVKLGRSKAIAAEAETLSARDRQSSRRDAPVMGDPGLFEALRLLRRTIAAERQVPPYVVFSDAVLQEIAVVRPTRRSTFLTVKGVGEKKLTDFGKAFADAIVAYCAANNLEADTNVGTSRGSAGLTPLSPNKQRALPMFEQGHPITEVAGELKLATSTVTNYLVEFLQSGRIKSTTPWLKDADRAEILAVATNLAADRLNPVFDHFGGRYSWDDIRLAFASAELGV
jgi:ATP-dependent DNA helicase RecQ